MTQHDLMSIFNAITPENIKNLPVIEDSMRIFIELLNEYSFISSEIRLALSEQTTPVIAEQLPKIYMYDYYSMIENLRTNKTVVKKFKDWNDALSPQLYPIGLPVIGEKLLFNFFSIGEELENTLVQEENEIQYNLNPLAFKLKDMKFNILRNTPENYYANRVFKQSKGLKKSINYIYDIVNSHLSSVEERRPLEFIETGTPFELKINGTIDKSVYDESVAYLAHPLGFTYDYTYLSELRFFDSFGLRKWYDIKLLEVRCLYDNSEVYDKAVDLIVERIGYLKILFKDGTYLIQENDSVKYMNSDDFVIKVYPPSAHCSIYLDYEIIYSTSLSDTVKFTEEKTFDFGFMINYSTIGSDIIGGESDALEILSKKDPLSFIETEKFQFGFILGNDIIGDKYITNDSDAVELQTRKRLELDLGMIIGDNNTIGLYRIGEEKDLVITNFNNEHLNIDSLHDITDDYYHTMSDIVTSSIEGAMQNGLVLGYNNIGDYLITNDSDAMNVMGYKEEMNYTETEKFQFGFILGNDIIGDTGKITSDTDLVEVVKFADGEIIEDLQTSDDEQYNTANIVEEFDIQII